MSQVNAEIKEEHFFSGKWLRKTTDVEGVMETAHQKGYLLIWYQLDLSSVEPLQEAQVRTALGHMYRKVPSLSVCYGTHEGETWFRRATNPNVDFEVVHGLRLEEVRESLRNYHYKSDTGPLFCARLLQDSPDTLADSGDLEPSFPNKSHIIFGFHHGITDGTSNMMLMGFFISLLNDVISNNPVNDEELLGTFASGEETLRLINEKKQLLENDPELMKKVGDDIWLNRKQMPMIVKGFPASKDKRHTASFVRVFNQDITARFIQRCRQEKVTVNSAFTALVNMAIVDVLIEHGVIQDSYEMRNFHTINLRRYWESKPTNPLGLHMGFPLIMCTKTPKDVRAKFWDYTKELGLSLKDVILTGRILSDNAYAMLISENASHSEESSPADHTYGGDFVTSNMGNITPIVTEGGDHVRVTNLVRGSTIHLTEHPILANCHTFRGIFTIMFDYVIGLVQPSVAEEIFNQFSKCLLELVE